MRPRLCGYCTGRRLALLISGWEAAGNVPSAVLSRECRQTCTLQNHSGRRAVQCLVVHFEVNSDMTPSFPSARNATEGKENGRLPRRQDVK